MRSTSALSLLGGVRRAVIDSESSRILDWARNEGFVGDAGVFIEFQREFGGVTYGIPGDEVFWGLWRENPAGGIYGPHGDFESGGLFSVSCGGYRVGQDELYLREDGCVFESDVVVSSSPHLKIEDHAMLVRAYSVYGLTRSVSIETKRGVVNRWATVAGLLPVSPATDAPYFSWFSAPGLLARISTGYSAEARDCRVQLFAADAELLGGARAALRL